MSLQSGLDALKQKHYQEAVKLLEQFCRDCVDGRVNASGESDSSDYLSAQMWLMKAYQGTGEIEKAKILCQSSDLKIQDRSGMLYLHYASRFGLIGNFLFGMKRVESLIGEQVGAVGWFRRGVAPWMDLIQLQSENGTIVNSYHRFWSFILGGGSIILGVVLIMFLSS